MKVYSKIVKIAVVMALLVTTVAPAQFLSTATYAASATTLNQSGLMVDIDGLDDLGEGWAYEGWLIVDGEPLSTGTFTVDVDGTLSENIFAVSNAHRDAATAFVLTIEPAPDDDPAPSDVHLLSGDFADGTSSLTVGHPAALGTDFTDASASYIIGIGYPEGATDENSYLNGIWYPNSLNLPELPVGWVYEGWIVGEDGPISTGRFTDPDAMDKDGSGPAAGGPGTGPDFPGQDFLDPALDIIGYAAVISVEPEPDNSAAPFTLKPLLDDEIEDVGGHGSQEMINQALSTSPTGSATFVEPMTLSIDGLEDVGEGWAYEGWLIVDGTPVSTGLFTIDDDGAMSESSFMVASADRANATAFVLTLEPSPDDDPAPSNVHLLGGNFAEGVADLNVAHPAALGNDFADISGSYILAAPSGGPDQPYVNGLWWEDPAGPSASLDLPVLPMGWAYEGWVVGTDGPISTGRFTTVHAADSDGAGPMAGPQGTPAYPGQDFVEPAIDLTSGYAAVISIEPEPDNSPTPFAYKPLVDGNIDDVGGLVLQPMAINLDSLATGVASFMDALHWEFEGLEPLGKGWAYEGWLIVDGAPVSTGVFGVDSDGMADMSSTTISSHQGRDATAFVLTIEPSPDSDPAPSDVHLLGGDLEDGIADLSIAHPAALGTDFADAAGSYIIGIGYTEGATDANSYVNGIWYPNSLDLPTLPAGWTYEGWVVGEDGPISTGRFTDPDAMDKDGSGPAAGGPGTGPEFPGQDFLNPATDIIGYAAVISVEPSPDDSAAPFVLKPLLDGEIADVGDHGSQNMANNIANSSPTGTVIVGSGAMGAMMVADEEEMVEEAAAGEEMADESDMGDAAAEPATEEVVVETGPRVVSQGELVQASNDYEGSGLVSLVQDGESYTLQFNNLVSSDGPGLYVLLVENADGRSNGELGDYVELGMLQSTTGNQTYTIPAGVDISRYSGAVIYCKPFHVVFSAAEF